MSWPYLPYFTEKELACRCGCGMQVRPELMDILVQARKAAQFAFIISSGARCPEHNNKVSSTGLNGPHTTGLAVDILVNGGKAFELVKLGIHFGMTGIGVSQKGVIGNRYIHLDCIKPGDGTHLRPWIWSY